MVVKMAPKVSVIFASYNHEEFVEKSVRSVMAQKGVDFELIVIFFINYVFNFIKIKYNI